MSQPTDFLRQLAEFYAQNARNLPWRQTTDPYKILASEIMLQQTQVNRVIPKYESFLRRFPTMQALASAGLADVLAEWVGLGYNRRARYLHEAAKALVDTPEPWTFEDLVARKGIGANTAAAVLVYAYDLPLLFIETNVRTVIIHHFFADKKDIADKEILAKLSEAVPWKHGHPLSPRDFYWALMDYGTYLKATTGNQNTRSRHYTKQSKFEGSRRQLRGAIIRLLAAGPKTCAELGKLLPDERLQEVLEGLRIEGLIRVHKDRFTL